MAPKVTATSLTQVAFVDLFTISVALAGVGQHPETSTVAISLFSLSPRQLYSSGLIAYGMTKYPLPEMIFSDLAGLPPPVADHWS